MGSHEKFISREIFIGIFIGNFYRYINQLCTEKIQQVQRYKDKKK